MQRGISKGIVTHKKPITNTCMKETCLDFSKDLGNLYTRIHAYT